jgi:hypothetical protein
MRMISCHLEAQLMCRSQARLDADAHARNYEIGSRPPRQLAKPPKSDVESRASLKS